MWVIVFNILTFVFHFYFSYWFYDDLKVLKIPFLNIFYIKSGCWKVHSWVKILLKKSALWSNFGKWVVCAKKKRFQRWIPDWMALTCLVLIILQWVSWFTDCLLLKNTLILFSWFFYNDNFIWNKQIFCSVYIMENQYCKVNWMFLMRI